MSWLVTNNDIISLQNFGAGSDWINQLLFILNNLRSLVWISIGCERWWLNALSVQYAVLYMLLVCEF